MSFNTNNMLFSKEKKATKILDHYLICMMGRVVFKGKIDSLILKIRFLQK